MAKTITIDDEIKELERELNTRLRIYPEWTKGPNPKVKPDVAAFRVACLESTIKRLKNEKGRIVGEQTQLSL